MGARVDDPTPASCENEEVSDHRRAVARADEGAESLAGHDPGALPQDVAPARLHLVSAPFLGVDVHRTRFSRDDAHALTQGGRGGNVEDLRRVDIDHAVVGRHDGSHARRQRPQQPSEARIELFKAPDPAV